jgi:hypothetical protein
MACFAERESASDDLLYELQLKLEEIDEAGTGRERRASISRRSSRSACDRSPDSQATRNDKQVKWMQGKTPRSFAPGRSRPISHTPQGAFFRLLLFPESGLLTARPRDDAMGHVWTAPGWQVESSPSSIGRCGHVFGLSARYT